MTFSRGAAAIESAETSVTGVIAGRRTSASSCATEKEAEPYYPINTPDDREKLDRYRRVAKQEASQYNVFFGGRGWNNKYLDMHMSIGSALTVFDNKIAPVFADERPLDGRHAGLTAPRRQTTAPTPGHLLSD